MRQEDDLEEEGRLTGDASGVASDIRERDSRVRQSAYVGAVRTGPPSGLTLSVQSISPETRPAQNRNRTEIILIVTDTGEDFEVVEL